MLEDSVPSEQLATHLPEVIEALRSLNKSLFTLDIAGLSIAAIHVDAAISNLKAELSELPPKRPKLVASKDIDFSTLDEMALTLFG